MKTDLTVVYITSRREPRVEWFLDSLASQGAEGIDVVIVAPEHSVINQGVSYLPAKVVRPKPTIWSGPHRITGADWWSAASARNTGICFATKPWIAFVDDRSVLLPGWLSAVRKAIARGYCVAGTYEKVDNLQVLGGQVVTFDSRGEAGIDSRRIYAEKHWVPVGLTSPFEAPGEWTFGCSLALPLAWALEVGGFEETCDGLGGEDYIFGLMLKNCGHPIGFDLGMKMLEDRTAGKCEPVPIRKDKGTSPNDKSHALLAKLRGLKRTLLPGNIEAMRDEILAGRGWPAQQFPTHDWYDNTPIAGIT